MKKYVMSLGEMMSRVKEEPPLKMVYSGIKENSIGLVFGTSKSGKTIFCENLLMSIAAGADEYLGIPIHLKNKVVMFYSLEEFYKNRTERNQKQVGRLTEKYGVDWVENYKVVDENMPTYISTEDDWVTITEGILLVKPAVVVFDSLTRMYGGSIEDSNVAKIIMKRLRKLNDETGATIICIHHTHKLYDRPLSIDTIAGSRVIAQECDFMIGLNRTGDGRHYIKDVAFRYVACDSESVKTFSIDENCWLNVKGEAEELSLLAPKDGRVDETNKLKIFEFMLEQIFFYKEEGVPIDVIQKEFVDNKVMSKQTMYNNIEKLEAEDKVYKIERGLYGVSF